MRFRRTMMSLGAAGVLASGVLAGPASATAEGGSSPSTSGQFAYSQTYYPWDSWDYKRGYQRGYWYGYRDARYDCDQDGPPRWIRDWSRDYRRGFWDGYRRGYWKAYRDHCRDGEHSGGGFDGPASR